MRRVPGFDKALEACLRWDPSALTRCPPAAVAVRAALARTPPVRALRPQPLSARFLAVALLNLALNTPLGAARAHTRKFSAEWLVAVHASVPFIALLRKALLMPPYALLVTVAAAVLGQAAGGRLELARLDRAAKKEQALAAARGSRRSTRRRMGPLVRGQAAPRGLGR